MSVTISLSEAAVFAALRGFLLSVLPPGTPVIRAYANRVPEPEADNFVLMSQLSDRRISTNVDVPIDCAFVGEITDSTLVVTAITLGSVVLGAPVFGATVQPSTVVTAFGTGTGGIGTYTIAPPQSAGAQPMAAGVLLISEAIDFAVQIDVHGPAAANNVRIISTVLRDEFATSYFEDLGLPITPLYADDPRYMSFVNEAEQYEYRWVVDAHLQIDPTVQVPQAFFDTITLNTFAADLAAVFALWGTNVPGQVVGTNISGEALSTGFVQSASGVVVV